MGNKMKFKVKAKPKEEGASVVPGAQAASFGAMPQFSMPMQSGGGDGGIKLILQNATVSIEKLIIKKKGE